MQASDPTHRFGRAFAWVAWLLLLGMIYLFFADVLHERRNPNQQLQNLRGEGGERIVVLEANNQGHFVGTLLLNGQPVEFLLDTGATSVAVSAEVARRSGMQAGRPYQTSTANGVVTVYQSRISSLQLGDIVLHDLEASIVPSLTGAEILLGMSALNQLEFSKQQRELRLIQR